MNITLERTDSSKIKYELEKAIQFNRLLLQDVACGFLFNLVGSYGGIHLITIDHLIIKYEKDRKIIVLERRAIEKIDKVNLSMIVFKIKGYDYNILKQWIAETEAELSELVKEIETTA